MKDTLLPTNSEYSQPNRSQPDHSQTDHAELNYFNSPIPTSEVVRHLKKHLQIKGLCQRILSARLIDQAAAKQGIIVTDVEIQAAIARWRHQNKFQKAADTLAWLQDQMVSVEDLEMAMSDRLKRFKLSQALFKAEAQRLFMQNKLGFAQVSFYQVRVANQSLAKELFFQIEEQEISFFEAAHRYNVDPARQQNCGYEGICYRRILQPDIAAYLFSAQAGTVLPPIATPKGHAIFYIQEFIPARLTTQLHQTLINELFQNWLSQELNYALHHQNEATYSPAHS